jgi:hypothetical protein
MKKIFMMLSLAAIMAGMAPAAHADLNGFLRSVNNQALSDIKSFNDRLSRQFGIPVPDVEAIVRSVPDPADAFMIFQLGEMAHVAPEVVLQKYQRSKGKGWGNLARELGIKPGSPQFHALKRGDLAFTGERGDKAMERRGGERGQGQEHGRGRGHQKD